MASNCARKFVQDQLLLQNHCRFAAPSHRIQLHCLPPFAFHLAAAASSPPPVELGNGESSAKERGPWSNMASRALMSMAGRIKTKLETALQAAAIEVDDVSYQHAAVKEMVGGPNETHFNVRTMLTDFEGKSLVKRHRMVYDLLSGLHALSITAKTPKETGINISVFLHQFCCHHRHLSPPLWSSTTLFTNFHFSFMLWTNNCRRWITAKNSCICYTFSSASAVSLLEDSDYSSSNCESNSENESDVLRQIVGHRKRIKLFSAVARVAKSLNWSVARKIRFTGAVKKYGFDNSIMGFKIIVHLYSRVGMELEVCALLRDIICYYREAGLDLFGMFYTVFDCLHEVEGSFVLADALIKVFASSTMLENAVDAFNQAKKIGVQPGIRASNFLLKCLVESNEKEFIVTLFEEMKNHGPVPNLYTYTIMMNFYCNRHCDQDGVCMEQATDILEEMEAAGINPSIVTYSTYILGLCRVGLIEVALDFINELRSKGQPLNCYCYNSVISAFVNSGEPYKALQVFDNMKTCRIAPDIYSYSILIDGFCRCGDVEKALSLFEEMEKGNIKPSLVTYSSLLKGFCQRGLMEISFDLFRKVGNSGYKYDQHAYNILITGFCTQGDMKSAHELLEEMIKNNLSPNASSYESLILGFCKIGSFEKAFKCFDFMTNAGIFPNTFICNHVIDGYCKEGLMEDALKLTDEMKKHGTIPNTITYSMIINMLCKDRKTEKALELIPVMLKCNMLPNVVTYSMLINGFARQENLRKAVMLYSCMLKGGVTPDPVTFTIFINVLSTMGMVKEAYNLFKEMILNGLNPDKISYTSMIAGFCRSKDMRAAWELFQEMVQRAILPSVVTYACLIDGFFKVNRMDMAIMLVEEMSHKNLCPDPVTYSVLIRGYRKLGFVDRAQLLYEEVRRRGIVLDTFTFKTRGTIPALSSKNGLKNRICLHILPNKSLVPCSC